MKIVTSETTEKGARSYSCEFDFGKDYAAAVKLFGEEVIFNNFVASGKIALQGKLRAGLKGKKTDAELDAIVKGHKPGTRVLTKKTALEKATDLYNGLSPEEKKAYLKSLKG